MFDFSSKITSDLTLEARFEAIGEGETDNTFTVTFDSNGGSTNVPSQSVAADGLVKKPSDPVREGYSFVEWQLDGKAYNFNSKVTKNITLKAVWKKDDSSSTQSGKFTVTFNYNGNGKRNTAVSVEAGKTVARPSNPSRSGYTFAGWYTNANGTGNPYNFNSTVSKSFTLYAKWTKNNSQEGGSGNQPATPTDKHVENVSISGAINIKVGETSQMTATVTPADANAEYKSVTWISSNPEVATVDANGLVSALKAGTTTITATTNDGKSASVTVTVTGNNYNIRITLNKTAEGMTSYTYKVEVFKDGQAFTGYKGFTVDGKVQYKAGSGTLGEGQVGQLSNSSKAVITLSDGTKVNNVSVEIIKN